MVTRPMGGNFLDRYGTFSGFYQDFYIQAVTLTFCQTTARVPWCALLFDTQISTAIQSEQNRYRPPERRLLDLTRIGTSVSEG